MRRTLRASLLASALALGAMSLVPGPALAAAYVDSSISFNGFQRALADDGDWFYSDRWGMVWQPDAAYGDWRPYTRGHWVNTYEYGWLWASDESFGDITYHYGRWVNDPDDGWLWLPGYTWSPAWVVWRQAGDYTGWMPMPPDRRFLDGDEFSDSPGGGVNIGFNTWDGSSDFYGYARWYGGAYSQDRYAGMWTFVPVQHFADRDYWRYRTGHAQLGDFVRRSRNVTNYTIVNNYIVNRSVDVKIVYRDRREPIRIVRAAEVIRRPSLVARFDIGRNIGLRMRIDMPRGKGIANSAPRPTRLQVEALTPMARERDKKNPAAQEMRNPKRHLLDRSAAEVVVRPDGSAPAALTPADVEKAKSKAPKPDKVPDKMKDNTPGTPPSANNPLTPPDNGAERKRNPRGDQTAPDSGNAATPTTPTTPPAAGVTPNPTDTDTKADRQARKKARQNANDDNAGAVTQPSSPDAVEPRRPPHRLPMTPDNTNTATPTPDTTQPVRPRRERPSTPDNSGTMTPPPSSPDATQPVRPRRERPTAQDNPGTMTPPPSPDATQPVRPRRERPSAPDSSNSPSTAAPSQATPPADQTNDKPKKHKPKPDADTPSPQ